MKRKTKRRIGIFLVVAMLAVLVIPAFSAMADDAEDFDISGGILNAYVGAGGDVVIPDTVTQIADGAFQDTNVTSVTIPSTVTAIGAYAFAECTNLSSISIPGSVSSMGTGVFSNCGSLSSVDLGSTGISAVPARTFYNSAVSSVNLPASVGSIGDNAFAECTSLGSINIPSGVTVISNSAFEGASNLTSITVSGGNPSYSSYDGCIYNKGMTKLLVCPEGKSSIQTAGNTSTYGTGAFSGCGGITTLDVPTSITTIESNAFTDSGIQTITIPASVKNIGSQASWDPAIIYTYAGSAGEAFAAGYNYEYELLDDATPVNPSEDPQDPNNAGPNGGTTNPSGTNGAANGATNGSGASVTTGVGGVTTASGSVGGRATGGAHVLDSTPKTGPEMNARVILCIAVFFVGIYLIISSRKEEKTA